MLVDFLASVLSSILFTDGLKVISSTTCYLLSVGNILQLFRVRSFYSKNEGSEPGHTF